MRATQRKHLRSLRTNYLDQQRFILVPGEELGLTRSIQDCDLRFTTVGRTGLHNRQNLQSEHHGTIFHQADPQFLQKNGFSALSPKNQRPSTDCQVSTRRRENRGSTVLHGRRKQSPGSLYPSHCTNIFLRWRTERVCGNLGRKLLRGKCCALKPEVKALQSGLLLHVAGLAFLRQSGMELDPPTHQLTSYRTKLQRLQNLTQLIISSHSRTSL